MREAPSSRQAGKYIRANTSSCFWEPEGCDKDAAADTVGVLTQRGV